MWFWNASNAAYIRINNNSTRVGVNLNRVYESAALFAFPRPQIIARNTWLTTQYVHKIPILFFFFLRSL